jgi:hypothetical protein
MKTKNITSSPTTQIFVLDRGWVFVGQLEHVTKEHVTISNARCIRRWGTTQGLAELVDGPKQDTVLDAASRIIVPRKSIIFELPCTRDW